MLATSTKFGVVVEYKALASTFTHTLKCLVKLQYTSYISTMVWKDMYMKISVSLKGDYIR